MRRLLLLFLLFISFTAAERVIRFTFNNGVALPGGETCNESDNLLIDAIFNRNTTLNTTVRHLGDSSSASNDQHHRSMPSWPTRCRQDCAGQADGMCKASGCNGYRRLGEEEAGRRLNNMTCIEEVLDVNSQLNALITEDKVSPECKMVLNSTRFPLCYDDIIFGVIESFNIWNGDTDTMIQRNASNGFEFCRSIPFNIEVVTNPCVDFIHYNVTGNMGFKYTEKQYFNAPYWVFKPNRTEILTWVPGDIYGRRNMRNGTYTLIVTPDGFAHKKKQLEFRLKNC